MDQRDTNIFERIKKTIESKRESKRLLDKVLVNCKDIVWKLMLYYPGKYFNYVNNYLILTNLIYGKKRLIVGTDPSGREIENILEDLLVFTCNKGV